MKVLRSTAALLALALLAGCGGVAADKSSAAVHTDAASAATERSEVPRSGALTGTVLETQQGALLHVHIRQADGRRIALVCDRECFPSMDLLQAGRRVRIRWQRQQVKAGDEVIHEDVITHVESR
jgi:hypothetical protein